MYKKNYNSIKLFCSWDIELEQGGGSYIKSLNIGSNPSIQYKITIKQMFLVALDIHKAYLVTIINYRKSIHATK